MKYKEVYNISMSKLKIILTGVIILLVSVGVYAVLQKDKQANEPVGEVDVLRQEYAGLPEDHRFRRLESSQAAEKLESGTGVVFLGFKECPWCQKLAPILNEAAVAENIDIYYYDIRSDREGSSETYQRILSKLKPHLDVDEEGNPRVYVPDVSIVKNGEIVWRHEMEKASADESKPDTYWTGERRERTITDFRENAQAIK